MAEPGTITATQLARLSDLTERHLRELSAGGWLPKPVDGAYQLVPAIQDLLTQEKRAVTDIKSIFVFLLSICYILEGISYSISSLSDFVGDNKKTIEIPERVLGFIV